jgi:phospholipid/cholesterol/gamma-HCH transport system ATP-binding protein
MIKVNNIAKAFEGHQVIEDVSFSVEKGEGFTIIGPSGCGKSTILKILIGLLKPDRGSILIDGEDITEFSTEQMHAVRAKFGFVFQSAALFDSMNVYDNIAFGLREKGIKSKAYIDKTVEEKLEWVELQGNAYYMPNELSGGMRKRVSIARALATNPEIMLYDEPTTGLDPLVSQTIEDLIVRLKKELTMASIVVTHQISMIARVSDKIAYMELGRLLDIGTVQNLFAETVNPTVKRFIQAGRV